ncbi:hypothetical protein [Halonatronum saccharophilum]|uniref:hypothetical protein n=1 Tax=Halonatronum saccharophilum TaxID=150060 RepID=UPI00047F0863|nr:hypothetical protein [Halonatronum saccharophilum]
MKKKQWIVVLVLVLMAFIIFGCYYFISSSVVEYHFPIFPWSLIDVTMLLVRFGISIIVKSLTIAGVIYIVAHMFKLPKQYDRIKKIDELEKDIKMMKEKLEKIDDIKSN